MRRTGPKSQPRMNRRCEAMLATTPPPACSFWKNQPCFGPKALAGEMLREAGVAVDEADQLGLRVNLEQVAVDHAHAAGADDRGPERAPLAHAASSNVRRSPSTSGVRRGR